MRMVLLYRDICEKKTPDSEKRILRWGYDFVVERHESSHQNYRSTIELTNIRTRSIMPPKESMAGRTSK
jgi:hypothetical protein